MSHSTGERLPTDPFAAGPRSAGTPAGSAGGSPSTKDVAADQAAQVGQEAKASGQHVADVAKDQAAGVASEAKDHARDLLERSRGELRQQAVAGQQRASGGLQSLAQELRDLADGKGGSGMVSDLAHQASQRVAAAATWLEQREPADLLEEVQVFARRRPGAFLAVAAGVGVLAGRLTRGLAANAHQDSPAPSGVTRTPQSTTPSTTQVVGSAPLRAESGWPGTEPRGAVVTGGRLDTAGTDLTSGTSRRVAP